MLSCLILTHYILSVFASFYLSNLVLIYLILCFLSDLIHLYFYLILSCLIFSYLIVSSIYLTICRFLLHQIRPWRLMARKQKSMASQRWGKRRWIDGAGGRFYPVQRVQMCCSPINGPIRFLCPSKIDFSVAKMMEGGSTWVQNVDARANKEVSNGRTCNWNPASKGGSHSLINRKFGAWPPTDGVFTVCFTWYPLSPIPTCSRCPAIHVYIPLGSTGPYASLAVGTISRMFFQEHRKILPTKCKMIIGECKRLNVQQHSTCQKWVHKQISNSQSKPQIRYHFFCRSQDRDSHRAREIHPAVTRDSPRPKLPKGREMQRWVLMPVGMGGFQFIMQIGRRTSAFSSMFQPLGFIRWGIMKVDTSSIFNSHKRSETWCLHHTALHHQGPPPTVKAVLPCLQRWTPPWPKGNEFPFRLPF